MFDFLNRDVEEIFISIFSCESSSRKAIVRQSVRPSVSLSVACRSSETKHHSFMKLCIRKAPMNLHMPVILNFWKILNSLPQGPFSCSPGVKCAITSKLLDEWELFLSRTMRHLISIISGTFWVWKIFIWASPWGVFECHPGAKCISFMFFGLNFL